MRLVGVKLCDYLKNKRSCTKLFFYTGIDNGDIETAEEFETLSNISGVNVISKPIFAYKNKDKKVNLKCPKCDTKNLYRLDMGYTKKSNCDVELSVDAIELATPEIEFLLFTGDGDFEYLIRKGLEKGISKVHIYSYAGKEIKSGITISRFSTKLRKLIANEKDMVFYTSLRDIQNIIKKDLPVV